MSAGHNSEEKPRTYFDDSTVAMGVLYTIAAIGVIVYLYFFA